MKKLFLILTAAFALTACHNDEETTPAVQFPETQVINCQTGEQKAIEFDAPGAWKLTASAAWCRFVQGSETALSLSGEAGHQTVTLAISSEGQSLGDETKAKLTLYINGQQGTLAELTRSAAGYELQLFDAAGNAADEITVSYDEYTTFQVQANFPFAATNWPEWAELRGGSLTGSASTPTTGALRSSEQNAKEGTITFQDRDGKATFTFKVKYAGMSPTAILIDTPDGKPWNWTVSLDGKEWQHEGKTYGNHVQAKVTVSNDDYELVYVEQYGDSYYIHGIGGIEVNWMHYNKTSGRITVDAATQERTGYIFAFARAHYDDIKDHLVQALLPGDDEADERDESGLRYRYLQSNLIICINQKDTKPQVTPGQTGEVGFKAISINNATQIPTIVNCYHHPDAAVLDHCEAIFHTREVFLLSQPSTKESGAFDLAIPIPYMYSDTWSPDSTYYADYNGNKLTEKPEPTLSKSESYMHTEDAEDEFWSFTSLHESDEPMLLVMRNSDGQSVRKVLYIHTKRE